MEVPSNSSLSTALHDASRSVTDGVGPQQMDTMSRMHEEGANKIIVTYILDKVLEFRSLCQFIKRSVDSTMNSSIQCHLHHILGLEKPRRGCVFQTTACFCRYSQSGDSEAILRHDARDW